MTACIQASDSTMYVYESSDATGFGLLRDSGYTPPWGMVRDPSIMRHTDGMYYVAHSTARAGNQIGLASSTDRVSWTFLGNVTLTASRVGSVWAPEWFIDADGSVNIIVSLRFGGSARGAFRPYKITATDSSLTTWSIPTPLVGLPAGSIELFIVRVGSTRHAFYKNSRSMRIELASAPSLTGPYTIWRSPDFVAGDGQGPALIPLDNGGWRLYFEHCRQGGVWFIDSYDTFRTWSAPVELPGLTGVVKHLTVVKEVVAGGPTLPLGRLSLRSADLGHQYWRLVDDIGCIEVVSSVSSTAVRREATFTVVRGLADPNGFSLRASDGRFLRQDGSRLRLGGFGATQSFDRDATFVVRRGLGARSVALESYSHPGRYIRRGGRELWIDLYNDSYRFRAETSFAITDAWS
ncbi:AbfB domain-containing protein [Parafrankia sp. EAN1pec]|uniref:AbfB domain-containing protein n=2 Tax=Parafrankia TaxID=2994362 RepID=UPI00269FDB9A